MVIWDGEISKGESYAKKLNLGFNLAMHIPHLELWWR